MLECWTACLAGPPACTCSKRAPEPSPPAFAPQAHDLEYDYHDLADASAALCEPGEDEQECLALMEGVLERWLQQARERPGLPLAALKYFNEFICYYLEVSFLGPYLIHLLPKLVLLGLSFIVDFTVYQATIQSI